jgi:hypothetical protein
LRQHCVEILHRHQHSFNQVRIGITSMMASNGDALNSVDSTIIAAPASLCVAERRVQAAGTTR